MANTRTIDNLGRDVSVSYAIAKELNAKDPDFLMDPSPFRDLAEISVTSPYVLNEFEELFNTTYKKASWANFSPPENFEGNRKATLFSFQLVPSIGTFEHQETMKEKIKQLTSKRKKERDQKDQRDDKEQQKMLDFLEELMYMDKIISDIFSKRGQYQRG